MNTIKHKILEFFKDHSGQYVSGEDISRKLGISRAYVWKHMAAMREDGYGIEAVPHLGYKLLSLPDKLYASEITRDLAARVMGSSVHYFDSVGSTNETAYELAEKGAKEGAVVIAESQTRGKGRMGRRWVSPPGGIYMSLILRPDLEMDEAPAITLAAALAAREAVYDVTGLETVIKWPNDILAGGKKLCGILTEIKAQPDAVDFVVLGIGVNVNTLKRALPAEATSLKENLSGRSVDRALLARKVLERFEEFYGDLTKYGFGSIREKIKARSAVIGRKIEVTEHTRRIRGRAVDIDEKGALIVEDENGSLRRVFSGDVVVDAK